MVKMNWKTTKVFKHTTFSSSSSPGIYVKDIITGEMQHRVRKYACFDLKLGKKNLCLQKMFSLHYFNPFSKINCICQRYWNLNILKSIQFPSIFASTTSDLAKIFVTTIYEQCHFSTLLVCLTLGKKSANTLITEFDL